VGLDTDSAADFADCAREMTRRCDVLVVAGGDGTFSDVLNAVHLEDVILGYLPMGTGNALRHCLGYRGSIPEIAAAIRRGRTRTYDLIRCDGGQLAFMASVGLDGVAVRLWEQSHRTGERGFWDYGKAVWRAVVKEYRPVRCSVDIDGETLEVARLLTLMVVKQPYYGFGIKVVPRARWEDGLLHVQCIPAGVLSAVGGVATAVTVGNRVGWYRAGRNVVLRTAKPLVLQTDGNSGHAARRFSFQVMPGALRIRH
jgi:diacylglycerol kinase family enzyme